MNNNLFKTLFIPAVACLLGACTESTGPDMETSGNSGAIRFAGPRRDTGRHRRRGRNVDRWKLVQRMGELHRRNGGTATSVFNAEKVTYVSGMWGYEGTRYWLPGNTYDFYALYPSVETLGDAVSSATCTDGTFTVKGFDATKGHDLMTAKKTGISVMAGQTEPPGPVALKFQHLLHASPLRHAVRVATPRYIPSPLRGWMSREITTAARNPCGATRQREPSAWRKRLP